MPLDHDAFVYGDWAALGKDFHPFPSDTLELGSRVVTPLTDDPFAAQEQPPATAPFIWTLQNELEVALIVYRVNDKGRRVTGQKVPPGSPAKPSVIAVEAPSAATFTYVVLHAASGAYVTGFNAKAGDVRPVKPTTLRDPNNPGLPGSPSTMPTPKNSGAPLPADSPPVLVGTGTLPKGYVVAREQHWQRSDDSYSLPGCASVVVTLSEMSGITKSSSTMETLAEAVGAGAGAGWGPISASVSASLSRSSTTTQQVTISSRTEATVVLELTNAYQVGLVVFLWQLVDRLLLIVPPFYDKVKAMAEVTQSPAIPKAYDPRGNPFPPAGALPCPKKTDG